MPRMTEAQWAKTTSVARLLAGVRATDRKWRLLACAFARELWPHLYARGLGGIVEAAEEFADGGARSALTASRMRLWRFWGEISPKIGRPGETASSLCLLFMASSHLVGYRMSKTAVVKMASVVNQHLRDIDRLEGWSAVAAGLTRCVIGNPFRAAPLRPEWVTPVARAIAEEVYRERRWEELPVVADALEDVGCDDAAVLGHLRGPGPHARGCHGLDWVLGKG